MPTMTSNNGLPAVKSKRESGARVGPWKKFFGSSSRRQAQPSPTESAEEYHEAKQREPEKWSMGVLNDKETDEVPGTFVHQR